MKIDPATGLIEQVQFIPSPNCDARPDGTRIDVVVIHAISLPPGEFGGPGIEQLFCNRLNSDEHPYYREIKDLTVSSHVLIRRDGEVIQFVPLHQRAWHAGQSIFDGHPRVNDYSVGIELEGTDETPFEGIQYRVLAEVTQALMQCYPGITAERIVGHADIAPGRKTDPGPYFDWKTYLAALKPPSRLA
jgi:AmpD protein